MSNHSLLIRALRGPLTLILVGTLFAVDHAGGLSFTKTWPVLIIFLGLIKLGERAMAGNEPQPPVPPSYPPQYPPQYPQGGAQ